jgi:hypothetical protein
MWIPKHERKICYSYLVEISKKVFIIALVAIICIAGILWAIFLGNESTNSFIKGNLGIKKIIQRVAHDSLSGPFDATYIDPRECSADEQELISVAGIQDQPIHSCETENKEIDGRNVELMKIEYGALVDCIAGCGYGIVRGGKIEGSEAVQTLSTLGGGISSIILPRMPGRDPRDLQCTPSKKYVYQDAFSESLNIREAVFSEKLALKYTLTQPYSCSWEEDVSKITLNGGSTLLVKRLLERTWDGVFYLEGKAFSATGSELKIVDTIQLAYVHQKNTSILIDGVSIPKLIEESLSIAQVDELLEKSFGRKQQNYSQQISDLSKKVSMIEQGLEENSLKYKQKSIVPPTTMMFDPESLEQFEKNSNTQVRLYSTGKWIQKEMNKILGVSEVDAEYYAIKISIIENPQNTPLERIIPSQIQDLIARDVRYGEGEVAKIYYEIMNNYDPSKERYMVYLPFRGGYFEVRTSGEIFSMPFTGAGIFNALISGMR